MSRIAFSICGYTDQVNPPSATNGWFFSANSGPSTSDTGGYATPATFSLVDAVQLVWRMKTLQLTYDVTATVIASGLSYPSSGSYNLPALVSSLAATDETQLIAATEFLEHTGSDSASSASFAYGSMYQNPATGEVKPFINANITFPTEPSGNATLNTLGSPTPDSGIFIASTTLPALNPVQFFGATNLFSYSGTVTIECIEWWPYDNGTGAIWDSSTGAQLIFPVPGGL